MDFARFMPKPNQLAVFFFAGVVLLSETVLFHATKFVLDYLLAMTVIGGAVAGIGLGALLASRMAYGEADVFAWCCAGTTGCLYLAAFALLRLGQPLLLLPATAAVFVGPSLFIARTFARSEAPGVYFFDMLGAGTAVGLTVYLYRHLGSEEIFLLLVTVIPLLGAVVLAFTSSGNRKRRVYDCLGLFLLSGVGGTLLYQQLDTGALNIARIVNPDAPGIPLQNMLRYSSRLTIARTYDSLQGRIDAMPDTLSKLNRTLVTYDGFFNDNFYDYRAEDYREYAQPHRLRFPQTDRRVVYGLVEAPQVFVIGAAADGILKTLREITPLEHIEAVEINPGILQMMQHDYLDQSGRVYEGLNVRQGNALAILHRSRKKYDVITLINTHSSRWIGALGPPDYLHTRESYDLYLDRLTDDGYLLFEERPDTRQGELGVKRMILTLYDCLQRRGVKDPAEHFFIWEFMSKRFQEKGGQGIETGSDMYYVGMVVSLKPFSGQRRQDLFDWYDFEWDVRWDERKQPVHYPGRNPRYAAYLKGKWRGERFGPFFDMIKTGDYAQLDPEFDATIVTDDRPFPSCATRAQPEIEKLVFVTSAICLLLGCLVTVGAVRGAGRGGRISALILYNLAVGGGYFFVEIMLIQAYQAVFLTPSTSLVLVLGVLLVGSALGGLLSPHVTPSLATLALCPVLLLALCAPGWILSLGLGAVMSDAMASGAVLLVGVNLGVYFPAGLLLAQRLSFGRQIPHLFALNSVAGSLATVVSFYLGIRIGYTWTILVAWLLYLLASVVLRHAARSAGSSRHP